MKFVVVLILLNLAFVFTFAGKSENNSYDDVPRTAKIFLEHQK